MRIVFGWMLLVILGCGGLEDPRPTAVAPFDAWTWWQGLSPCVQKALLGDKPSPTDASGVQPLLTASKLVIYPNCEKPIDTLEWIRPLESLTMLSVRDQPITDLSPLEDVPFLRDLTFEYWKLSEWPASLTLPQLESLRLQAQLTDLRFLERHKTLKNLRLESIKAKDLSPLRALPLEELSLSDLSDLQITDLSALSGKESLRVLDILYAPIPSIEPISTLRGLKTLRISGPNRSEVGPLDLTPLAALGLTTLGATNRRLQGLEVLGQMKTLTVLDLSETDLQNLDVIDALPLEELMIAGTQVSNGRIEAYQAAHPGVSVVYEIGD